MKNSKNKQSKLQLHTTADKNKRERTKSLIAALKVRTPKCFNQINQRRKPSFVQTLSECGRLSKMGLLTIVILILIGLITFIYLYFKKKFSYWKDRGVVHPEPSFPLGNLSLKQVHFTEFSADIYKYSIFRSKTDRNTYRAWSRTEYFCERF